MLAFAKSAIWRPVHCCRHCDTRSRFSEFPPEPAWHSCCFSTAHVDNFYVPGSRGVEAGDGSCRTMLPDHTSLPTSELYGLTSQLRRAAVSIPSNIAEGHCRRSTRAYANHVSIALGSHGELATCIDLCARLGFVKQAEVARLLTASNSVGRLLNGLYNSLERTFL